MHLFQVIPLLLSLSLLTVSAVSCSWDKSHQDGSVGPIRVQIPFGEKGQYRLQVVELFTVESLTDFRGGAARFFMLPETRSGELRGENPQLRYIRNNEGIVIPKDNLSLQLLTVYAHMERLQQLDEAVGAAGILTYPRKIAVTTQSADSSAPAYQQQNNASYMAPLDALSFVPYTLENLPLMANGGVLAHEHFHALFQQLFIQPLGKNDPWVLHLSAHALDEDSEPETFSSESIETKTKTQTEQAARQNYHSLLLRGWNEGLADVWGWVYSGDVEFVGRSLLTEKIGRKVDAPLSRMDSLSKTKEKISGVKVKKDQVAKISYPIGTQVARALLGMIEKRAQRLQTSRDELRPLMGKWIVRILPVLAKKFEELKPSESLSPGEVLLVMATQIQQESPEDCVFLAGRVPVEDRNDFNVEQICQSSPVEGVDQ